jgi:hypothetical protein
MIRLALCFALLAYGAAASAQSTPPDDLSPTPSQSERQVCDEVEALLASHQIAEARARLDAALAARAIDPTSTHPFAVLRRLADAMDRASAPQPPAPSQPLTLPPPPPAPPANRDERTSIEVAGLYAATMGYGLATGAWLDAQLEITDFKALPWLPLVGLGAGAVAAYLADNPRAVRSGVPTALGAGLSLGLLGGAALGLQGWRAGQWGVPTMATVTWAGATLGLGAGVGLAALTHPRPGTGAFILSGGFWGTVLGFMTGYATGDDEHFGSFALGGEAIGVAAAAATAGLLHPSQTQVRWMDLGALTGGLVGVGVGLLLLRNERAPFAAAVELGTLGGGVAGFLFGASRNGASRGSAGASHGLAWTPAVMPVQGGAMVTLSAM